MTAPASCGPTREMALLMADARPAWRVGTDLIRAVVNGATITASPKPKMIE
jgi:hypothetical protein